jgi:hypothetical protein
MPYNITLSNGVDVITINDGVSDTSQLSIPLVGKNHQGYGEEIAQSFIHMLENFANSGEPANPTEGQIWYNSSVDGLFVYDGTEWRPVLTGADANGFGNILPADNLVYDIGSTTAQWNNVYANTFNGTATRAQYADLAERYHADKAMEPGDVVMIGGTKEITKTKEANTPDVFGVVSTEPGLMLNSDAGDDNTHPYVALAGRVPVKVKGPVKKGQRLVASDEPGVAMAAEGMVSVLAVIGRALKNKTTKKVDLVEAVVGAK